MIPVYGHELGAVPAPYLERMRRAPSWDATIARNEAASDADFRREWSAAPVRSLQRDQIAQFTVARGWANLSATVFRRYGPGARAELVEAAAELRPRDFRASWGQLVAAANADPGLAPAPAMSRPFGGGGYAPRPPAPSAPAVSPAKVAAAGGAMVIDARGVATARQAVAPTPAKPADVAVPSWMPAAAPASTPPEFLPEPGFLARHGGKVLLAAAALAAWLATRRKVRRRRR